MVRAIPLRGPGNAAARVQERRAAASAFSIAKAGGRGKSLSQEPNGLAHVVEWRSVTHKSTRPVSAGDFPLGSASFDLVTSDYYNNDL